MTCRKFLFSAFAEGSTFNRLRSVQKLTHVINTNYTCWFLLCELTNLAKLFANFLDSFMIYCIISVYAFTAVPR